MYRVDRGRVAPGATSTYVDTIPDRPGETAVVSRQVVAGLLERGVEQHGKP